MCGDPDQCIAPRLVESALWNPEFSPPLYANAKARAALPEPFDELPRKNGAVSGCTDDLDPGLVNNEGVAAMSGQARNQHRKNRERREDQREKHPGNHERFVERSPEHRRVAGAHQHEKQTESA